MGFPEDLLTEGERIVIHKHPHWKMLLLPYLVLVVTAAVGIYLAVLADGQSWRGIAWSVIGAVALIVIAWLFLVPFVRWRTTHFVMTTDRVMSRSGVLNRTGLDIPLTRVNSVRFEHGLVDRMVGCGTLIIESASDEPLKFSDIPKVESIHSLLYREINDNPDDDFDAEKQQTR